MFVEYPREKKHLIPNSGAKDNLKLPIFLIPGILGYGAELYKLAEEIDKVAQSERPIYIYNDPRATEPNKSHATQSLAQHGEQVASELAEILVAKNATSSLIVGYSFGCSLAICAAEKLQEWNYDPTVYQIDSATPELMSKYLQNNSSDVTENIIKILNYAAKLSGFTECQFPPKAVKNLALFTFNDQFEKVRKSILKTNEEKSKPANFIESSQKYSIFANIAKQNLTNLINYTPNANKIGRMAVLFTDETAAKHPTTETLLNGWKSKVNSLQVINDIALTKKSHGDLIDDANCLNLATSINNYFVNEITEEYFLLRILSAYSQKSFFAPAVTKVLQSVSPPSDNEINLPSSSDTEDTTSLSVSVESDSDEIIPTPQATDATVSTVGLFRKKSQPIDIINTASHNIGVGKTSAV